MRSKKAAAVMTALLYTQALLGFAAVLAVLMKEPEAASVKKGSVSISAIENAVKSVHTAG